MAKMMLGGILLLSAVGGAARAEDARTPGFVTIDREDAASRGGVEAAYVRLKDDPNTTLLAFDAHAHYVDPGTGLGEYATIPAGYATGGGLSENAVGDGELGWVFARAPAAD